MASQACLSSDPLPIIVHLRDMQNLEFFPERTILLESPLYEIRVGRGSQTEACLHPQKSNAWFTSRVMSREHAILRADPISKEIYLEDSASMHGTYINGKRLEPNQPMIVRETEMIQFGTEIVRGDQIYKPLQLSMDVKWEGQSTKVWATSLPCSRPDLPSTSKNSFSVAYSDEEEEDDDEVKFVFESLRKSNTNTNRQPRCFSVPDSDDDISSDAEKQIEADSAPSSPAEVEAASPKKFARLSPVKPTPNNPTDLVHASIATTPGSTLQNALNLSDDEDEHGGVRGVSVQELYSASIYSDEEDDPDYPDFSEDDVESNHSSLGEQFDEDEDDEEEEEEAEDDDEEREDEEEAYNDMHGTSGNFSVQPVHPGSDMHHRTPSPSDAAMPKSSWYSSNNLPTINGLADHPPVQPYMTFSDHVATVQPTAAHATPFGYASTWGWPAYEANSTHSGFPDSFNVPPVFHPIHHSGAPMPRPLLSIQNKPVQASEEPDHSPVMIKDDNLAKPSKVSINDIIDDVQPDSFVVGGNRKRKADEISTTIPVDEPQKPTTDDNMISKTLPTVLPPSSKKTESASEQTEELTNSSSLSMEVQNTPAVIPEKNTPTKKSVTFSPEAVIINADSDRPRKKVRIEKESQGGTFFKYLAATVAGATIGAVGTVFGLAALPADYFM